MPGCLRCKTGCSEFRSVEFPFRILTESCRIPSSCSSGGCPCWVEQVWDTLGLSLFFVGMCRVRGTDPEQEEEQDHVPKDVFVVPSAW